MGTLHFGIGLELGHDFGRDGRITADALVEADPGTLFLGLDTGASGARTGFLKGHGVFSKDEQREHLPLVGEAVDSPGVARTCGAAKLNAHRSRGAHTMLRAGDALRFTPDEIEAYRKLGLDFDGARTQDDIDQALTRWADTLNDERPDLLEKIAAELANARGITLPARLTRIR